MSEIRCPYCEFHLFDAVCLTCAVEIVCWRCKALVSASSNVIKIVKAPKKLLPWKEYKAAA